MDLYLLAELKTISLKVTTVDMQKPPQDFRYSILLSILHNVLFYSVCSKIRFGKREFLRFISLTKFYKYKN